MGKKKPKIEVVKYFMSIHYGVCHSADALLGIRIDDKPVWKGRVENQTDIHISKEDLFGGIKKEGGVEGTVSYLPGFASQVLPSFLARRLGLTPETAPGYRGVTSLWFTGGSHGGFYWRANTPYLPGVAVQLERRGRGLNQAFAMIGPDANPTHIIYEAMTSTDFGMGSPSTSFDIATFEAASETLYNEKFGLTMGWIQQAKIESFVSEVIDHINAALYVSPVTGLWTIKLIRDDYDRDSLPIISPSNAKLSNFQRKLWGETVNEIVTTWKNPDNEEDETVSMQDLANIAMQGGIVSDSRNYYGVRNKNLAMELTARDLRVAAAPTASCEAVLSREFYDVHPGGVIKLSWPEYGIQEAVMRIGKVDYGKPGDSTVKCDLVEDIFSLTTSAYVSPPSTEWIDTDEDPRPLDFSKIMALPYYMAVNLLDSATVSEAQSPETFVAVLGAQGGQDTSQFELFGNTTDSLGNLVTESLGTFDIACRALLGDILPWAVESLAVPYTNSTQGEGPVIGGFAVIGGGSDAECELAVVSDVGLETVSLRRGVLDTVPREWPLGTPIWFINSDMRIHDESTLVAGQTVHYWPCPWTSRGMLPFADAVEITGTPNERPWLPFRPANVKVAGLDHGEVDATGETTLAVTWSNRNRTMEDSVVSAWDEGNVAPEAGQTTTITVMDGDRNILNVRDGLTGTSFALPMDDFAGNGIGYARITAKRDGLESLQGAEFKVFASASPYVAAASNVIYAASADNVSVSIPVKAKEGDLLFACVMHRSALTLPAGWTLVSSVQFENTTTGEQNISVISNAADATSAGSVLTLTQAAVDRMAVQIVAVRSKSEVAVLDQATAFFSSQDAKTLAVPAIASTGYDQTFFAIGSTILATTTGVGGLAFSAGWKAESPTSGENVRLVTADQQCNAGDISSGTLDATSEGGGENGMGAVALLLGKPYDGPFERIRIFVEKSNSVNYCSFYEVYLYDAAGNRLTDTLPYTVTARGQFNGSMIPPYAFDGNTSTRWATNFPPEKTWIEVEFEQPVDLAKIGLMPFSTSEAPRTFRVQGAHPDSDEWTDLLRVTDYTGWSGTATREWDVPVG